LPTGLSAIQPLRIAKRTMLCRVASASAAVFSEQPFPLRPVTSPATSSTPIVRISGELERRQQMLAHVVAMRLERPFAPLAGGDPRLAALEPTVGHGCEPHPRRHGQGTGLGRRDQQLPLAPGHIEGARDRAEAGLARQHEADCVLAVGLPVDTPLDPAPLRRRLLRLHLEPRSRSGDKRERLVPRTRG
jgi:hypothetical protein